MLAITSLSNNFSSKYRFFITYNTWNSSLDYLVFRHEISLALDDNFFGGAIVLFWKRFKNYFIELRVTSKRENYGEWVQWLAEQFEKRESKTSLSPAHIQFRGWKEKNKAEKVNY